MSLRGSDASQNASAAVTDTTKPPKGTDRMNTKDVNQLKDQPNPQTPAELARNEASARAADTDPRAKSPRAKCTIEAVTPTPANQSPQGVTITLKAVSDQDNSEFFAENPNGRFVVGNSVYVDFTPAR